MASVTSLDQDMRKLRLDRYTPQAANEVKSWIESILGDRLPAGDLLDSLKDGVILCKLANLVLPPPGIKYKASSMPFVQMENISHFLTACELPPLRLASHDRFLTVDLYDNKDPAQVLQCLGAFSRAANAANPRSFPTYIGPKRAAATSPTRKAANGARSTRTSGASNPRDRGFSNVSENSDLSSPAARATSPAFAGDQLNVSSRNRKTDDGADSPAWNTRQYGYMGGANQGNQGISFGAHRQIVSPNVGVPTLAEKEKRRRDQDAEAERQRLEALETERQRQAEREAEEERMQEQSRTARERERVQLEREKRQWEEEEQKWKEEEERRKAEEEQELRKTIALTSQASSQTRRVTDAERVRELEKQLEEARERERQYELGREQQHPGASDVKLSTMTDDESRRQTSFATDDPLELSLQQTERETLREEWEKHRTSIPQPEPSPSPPPSDPSPMPQTQPSPPAAAADTAAPQPKLQPLAAVQAPSPVKSSLPLPGARRSPSPAKSSPFGRPSPATPRAMPAAAVQRSPSPDKSTSPLPRPLPDPRPYYPASTTGPNRTDRFLATNTAPAARVPRAHFPAELGMTSTAERVAEDERRAASQAKTKAGGWASKSLLEREMEKERERQREWEEAQMQRMQKAGRSGGLLGPRELKK